MSRKRQQTVSQPAHDATDAPADPQYQPRPKTGPGQVFRRETFPVPGGGKATYKRYRNIGQSPLLLAFERGQLASPDEAKNPSQITAQERYDYGEKFAQWWAILYGTGSSRDSTQPRISGGQGRVFTEQHEHAKRQIALLRSRMASRNYLIVEAFCGDGWSMLDALRRAGVEAHPVGTAYRVREALDDLVCTLTGRIPVPIIVPAGEGA